MPNSVPLATVLRIFADPPLSGLRFLGQRHPLGYAKTVLLIGHHQTQLTEGYTVLQQCMGADDNLYLTGGQLFF